MYLNMRMGKLTFEETMQAIKRLNKFRPVVSEVSFCESYVLEVRD